MCGFLLAVVVEVVIVAVLFLEGRSNRWQGHGDISADCLVDEWMAFFPFGNKRNAHTYGRLNSRVDGR